MKVLVTGATGFIGNYVVGELLRKGHTVIASSSNAQKASAAVWFKQVNYIALDLHDFDDAVNYYQLLQEPDILIHLAWEGLPNYKDAFHEEVNLPLDFSFLSNLIRHGLDDLTVTGTCFEYGMQEGCLVEEMPSLPANAYGRAKNELQKRLESLKLQHSFSLKWVRLFYMYGKGQNPKSLLSQLDRALAKGEKTFNMSGGQQVRDFLPVEEVAGDIVKVALQDSVEGIINICSGKPVTVQEFVEEYLKQKNRSISLNLGHYPYPDYEPMSFWGDTSKLNRIIHNE